MKKIKEFIKKEREDLKDCIDTDGTLTDYGDGKFELLTRLENLILFGVVRQSEQLKEKKLPVLEDWIKLNYRYYTNSIYIGKKDNNSYHFKEIEKYYDKIKDSL